MTLSTANNERNAMDESICEMCDGHIFIVDDHGEEGGPVWSHFELTGCDNPIPAL